MMRRLKSKYCNVDQQGDELTCETSDFHCPKMNNRGDFGSDCFRFERRA